MKLLLSHKTARTFWRRIYSADCPASKCYCDFASDFVIPNKAALDLIPQWALADGEAQESESCETQQNETSLLQQSKVHILVNGAKSRRHHNQIICHTWASKLDKECLAEVSGDVLTTTPAMDFLLATPSLSLPQLISYGNELCGLYSFDRSQPRGIRSRSIPLITKSELMGFLQKRKGFRGGLKATRAAAFIVENCASPMESLLAMLLCLPCSYGGYGLPQPIMNFPIKLNERAQTIAHKNVCYGDLCYPEHKVIIEYHGRFNHTSVQDFDNDRARVNALKEMGYSLLELTADQVKDLFAFEALALTLASMLDKYIRPENRGPLSKRINLRNALFRWGRQSGEPIGL